MAKTPLRKRRYGWIIWLVVLVGGALLGYRYIKHRPIATIPVRIHRVERGRVRDLVSTVAAGRVAAVREASLRAEIAGTVLHLHHRRGDHVAAGEPLIGRLLLWDGLRADARVMKVPRDPDCPVCGH